MEEQIQPEIEPAPASPSASPRGERYLRFKRSHLYAALLPLAFVAGLASGFLFWGRTAERSAASSGGTGRETNQGTPGGGSLNRFEVSADNDPALGPEDSPIVIVEFSDFSCPFCQKFHQETFTDLMDAYPDQIRFVYRDFPIVGGGQVGYQAAQAANCAAEQGDSTTPCSRGARTWIRTVSGSTPPS